MALTKKDFQILQEMMQTTIQKSVPVLLMPIYDRLDAMDKRLDGMDERFDAMDKRLDGMDRKFEKIDLRFERLESDIDSLKAGQLDLRKDIRNLDRKVSATYELALDAWGQGAENRTWLRRMDPGTETKFR